MEIKNIIWEVDGTFPNHHPDPSEPENLSFCIDYVIKSKSDVGLLLMAMEID